MKGYFDTGDNINDGCIPFRHGCARPVAFYASLSFFWCSMSWRQYTHYLHVCSHSYYKSKYPPWKGSFMTYQLTYVYQGPLVNFSSKLPLDVNSFGIMMDHFHHWTLFCIHCRVPKAKCQHHNFSFQMISTLICTMIGRYIRPFSQWPWLQQVKHKCNC